MVKDVEKNTAYEEKRNILIFNSREWEVFNI